MGKLTTLLVVLAALGCGTGEVPATPADAGRDAAPVACAVDPTAVVGFHDCGGTTKDGYRCFSTCGVVDFSADAGPAVLLSGCLVGQAETPVPALCVASCSDCQ